MRADAFHEWPLVVFTTLATMGAGLLASALVAALVAPSGAAAAPLMLPGTALLAAGLAASLAHLGQPQRAALALTRVGRSRLSSEVALAGGTLLAGIAAVSLPDPSPAVNLLSAVLAVAFLAALGLVYSLAGQATWRGAAVLSPLTMGLAFGGLGLAAAPHASTPGIAAVAALLAADGVLFLSRRLTIGNAGALPRRAPAAFAGMANAPRCGSYLLAVRFLLADILPACLLLAHFPRGAAGSLGLGILVDRVSFYLLAAQRTTEGEIAAVEEVMARH